MIRAVITLLYLIAFLVSSFVAYYFYTTKNGMLRRVMIGGFLTTGLHYFFWVLVLEDFGLSDWVWLLSLLPVTIFICLMAYIIAKREKGP